MRDKEKGQKYLSQKDRGLPLDRETDVARGQMMFYKGIGGNPVLG